MADPSEPSNAAGGAASDGIGASPWAPPSPTDSAPVDGDGAALRGAAVPAGEPSPRRLRRKRGGRTRQVKLRLSDDEFEQFHTAAEAAGVSVQRFIVETVTAAVDNPDSGRPPPLGSRQREALLATFLATRRTLAGAANNLNQLTRWSHANEAVHPEIDAAQDAVNAAASRLRLDLDALDRGLSPQPAQRRQGSM